MAILAITSNTTVQNEVSVDTQVTGLNISRILQTQATLNYFGDVGGVGNFNADNSSTFFFATGLSSLPADSVITSATLYFYTNGGFGSQDVNARRALRLSVIDEVTYNVYSTGNSWATPGAIDATDTAAPTGANVSVGAADTYFGIDVTDDVQMITDGASNYGWMVFSVNQNAGSGFRFVNDATATDGTRPELIIEYTSAPTEDVEISFELRESGVAVADQNWLVTVYEDAAGTAPLIATATIASVDGVITVNNDLLGDVDDVVWVHAIASTEAAADMAGIIFPETVYDAAV